MVNNLLYGNFNYLIIDGDHSDGAEMAHHVQANALSLLCLMWEGGGVGKHRAVYHLRMGEEHGSSGGHKGNLCG
jgi:hypothetical protein